MTVDDDGIPCAGFRQCGSITGLTGLNPAACTKNENLTDWGEPEFIFPVRCSPGRLLATLFLFFNVIYSVTY